MHDAGCESALRDLRPGDVACCGARLRPPQTRRLHRLHVNEGLRWGFRAGFDSSKLFGHRWFKNYPTALKGAGRSAVIQATLKRVGLEKTPDLGEWSPTLAAAVKQCFHKSAIFPMGCVPKPLEPEEMRPVDDHTRTGFNAATDLSLFFTSFARRRLQ